MPIPLEARKAEEKGAVDQRSNFAKAFGSDEVRRIMCRSFVDMHYRDASKESRERITNTLLRLDKMAYQVESTVEGIRKWWQDLFK